MFDKWRKYSYVAQKERRLQIMKILLWLFIFFTFFSILGTLFISTVVQENETMKPGIVRGDRFIVSPFPFGARLTLFSARLPGPASPQRGDLVILERDPSKISGILRMGESLIRFFSGQRASVSESSGTQLLLKRVAGIPGDTVSMTDHILRVKPEDTPYSLTEFELSASQYDINIPRLPEGWDSGLPLSGTMDTIRLGKDQYFVVSDDRSASNDSRVWGPVSLDEISGKVLFRYWPLSRIGSPYKYLK